MALLANVSSMMIFPCFLLKVPVTSSPLPLDAGSHTCNGCNECWLLEWFSIPIYALSTE